jgi:2-polyprenyl-3-methyl-5-hydroxy-6-metoxy-1,4-benzoquinol methylase
MIPTAMTYRGREKYDLKTALAYQRVSPAKHRAEMNLLDRAFALVPKHYNILDIPCGGGRVSIHLSHQGYAVEAADLSEAMVGIAAKNVADSGVPCIVERQDVEEMTYLDSSVDAIVCFRLFHHFPDPATRQRCVSQLCRVARRLVVISYFSPLSATSLRRTVVAAAGGKRSPKHSTSLREIQGYFKPNGFELVRNFARMPFIHTLHVAVFERKESE